MISMKVIKKNRSTKAYTIDPQLAARSKQVVQPSATTRDSVAILQASLVNFAATALCSSSQWSLTDACVKCDL